MVEGRFRFIVTLCGTKGPQSALLLTSNTKSLIDATEQEKSEARRDSGAE